VEPATTGPPPSGLTATTAATWACPACGHDNAIGLDACEVCGTTFAAMMRQGEARPEVEPTTALMYSLALPGLGHTKMGMGIDGVARGVLVIVLLTMTVLLFLTGTHSGPLLTIFVMFLVLTIVVYLGTALEAYRIADGGQAFISPKAMLWGTVAVIMVSISLLALSILGAAKR
jgi:hypothetical protein